MLYSFPQLTDLLHNFASGTCASQGNWDNPLQGELLNQWQSILTDLELQKSVCIPSCYFWSNPVHLIYRCMIMDFVMLLLKHMQKCCISVQLTQMVILMFVL